MGADVNWNLIRRPKALAKFDIQPDLDTAHVACLRIFPGIKPESMSTHPSLSFCERSHKDPQSLKRLTDFPSVEADLQSD